MILRGGNRFICAYLGIPGFFLKILCINNSRIPCGVQKGRNGSRPLRVLGLQFSAQYSGAHQTVSQESPTLEKPEKDLLCEQGPHLHLSLCLLFPEHYISIYLTIYACRQW